MGGKDGELLLSDIELAYSVYHSVVKPENSAFVKDDIFVVPHPSANVSREKPVYIYYEISNLLLDIGGTATYDVEYALTKKKSFLESINPFSDEKSFVGVAYTRDAFQRNRKEFLALNFTQVEPGEYVLSLRISDHAAQTSKRSEIGLRVVE